MTDEPIDPSPLSPLAEETTKTDPPLSEAPLAEVPVEIDPTPETPPADLSSSADQREGTSGPSAPEEDSGISEALPGENVVPPSDDLATADGVEDQPTDGTDKDTLVITQEELLPVIECLIFVADEPITLKQIAKVLPTVPEEEIEATIAQLLAQYEARGSGLELRPVAGGWRFSTRPQYNDFIRGYHRSRPSARLSLPALETLAVIAYKQPVTVPEILEIRGVSSSSAIKTLLDKGLIETKGRKETVGRPMMYGTAKKFLLQFGLSDLTELPSIEDFEDLVQ
ncbi:MAG: SMC-Scp complex subunit ScpB [Blastocatellia bacterium]|jgi:segregation and condensation protein B